MGNYNREPKTQNQLTFEDSRSSFRSKESLPGLDPNELKVRFPGHIGLMVLTYQYDWPHIRKALQEKLQDYAGDLP